MASIKIPKEQWPDLVVAFLLDKVIKGDEVLGYNDDFNELADVLDRKGLKPILLHYFLSSDVTLRSKYKTIQSAFKTGETEGIRISIDPSKEVPKDSTLKSLIKKALKLVVAHKKKSGFPLSEEKVDRIIDKLLEEEFIDIDKG